MIVSENGHFAYLLSSNSPETLVAHLRSPYAEGERCLYFFYQMFGSKRGQLGVFVSKDSTSLGENRWSAVNEVSSWNLGWLEISEDESFQVVIEAIVANDSISDIAIDDLNMVEGTCAVAEEDNKCNFDSGFWHYYNYQEDDQLDWILHRRNDPPLGSVPRENGFIYIGLTHDFNGDDVARISSPKFNFNITGRICVDFFYYLSDGAGGEIEIYTGHIEENNLQLEKKFCQVMSNLIAMI